MFVPIFRTHNLLVNKHIFKSIVSLDCTKDVARQNSGTNLIQRGANLFFFLSFVDNIQNLNVFFNLLSLFIQRQLANEKHDVAEFSFAPRFTHNVTRYLNSL